MDRGELEELHYITHISNLPSIMSKGILSHRRMKGIPHADVSMPEIQKRRAKKQIPGGQTLHDYVNLYINGRNKMLFKVLDSHADTCVLHISTDVLDLPNVVIADRNASSDYVRFAPAPDGLENVDEDLVFAEFWTHSGNPIEEMRHGSIICAEVLVPDSVNTDFIMGAYVSGTDTEEEFEATGVTLPVTIDSHLFFR